MRAKFGVLEQTQGLHLRAKFHLNLLIVSASGGQKPQFWANFDIFGGSCTDPLLGSYTLVVAPMGVKFGMEESVPSSMLNFTPIGATCRPCGVKNLKIGL